MVSHIHVFKDLTIFIVAQKTLGSENLIQDPTAQFCGDSINTQDGLHPEHGTEPSTTKDQPKTFTGNFT